MLDIILFTKDEKLSLDFQNAHAKYAFGELKCYKSARSAFARSAFARLAKCDIVYIDYRLDSATLELCYNIPSCVKFLLITEDYDRTDGFDCVGSLSDCPKNLLKLGFYEVLNRVTSCPGVKSH